ncbi:hypothetical protein C0989_002610 [Termitomyces sp. Mn162]|nr:hypothetical protein C0989_002610 [Termitomyces sp. Mn162]
MFLWTTLKALTSQKFGQVRTYCIQLVQTYLTSHHIGKDYSNPRITDFHTLNKPEEDMYDRTKVPRMPWYTPSTYSVTKIERALSRHDVGMQVVGQPARDLARHFVQRLVMGQDFRIVLLTYVSKIRIILECQNRTISRGPNSVFARLRKEGIDVRK